LIVRRKGKRVEGLSSYESFPHKFARTTKLDEKWEFERKDPNALTLDYCELEVANTGPTQRIPVWQAQRILRQAGVGASFVSRFRFRVVDHSGSLSLAIEDPKRYHVTVNGEPLSNTEGDGWWDSSIRRFDITALVHQGENLVEMSGTVGLDTEFENIYVLGDFALSRDEGFAIVREPRQVKAENLTLEGYPFFTGSFVLKRSLEIPTTQGRVYLKFGELSAIVVRISLNGSLVDYLLWKPHMLEITDHLQPGKNRLEIELCTSLHNLLGPHHSKQGEARHFVLEHSWADVANWTDEYFFVPVGFKGAELCYTTQ
jgi:hypothetical protein